MNHRVPCGHPRTSIPEVSRIPYPWEALCLQESGKQSQTPPPSSISRDGRAQGLPTSSTGIGFGHTLRKELLVKIRAASQLPEVPLDVTCKVLQFLSATGLPGFCHTCTHLSSPSTVLIASVLVELPLSYKSKHNSLFPVKLKKINV